MGEAILSGSARAQGNSILIGPVLLIDEFGYKEERGDVVRNADLFCGGDFVIQKRDASEAVFTIAFPFKSVENSR